MAHSLDVLAKIGIDGNGYDALDIQLDYLKLFIDAGLPFFLDRFPTLSPDFSKAIMAIREEYSRYIERNEFVHGFGQNYELEIRDVEKKLSSHIIFVYGTLMKGEYNHRLIESQELEVDRLQTVE